MLFAVFLLIVSLEVIESRFLVKTLPGLDGDLPFTLETGYIGVGELDDVQLFYYFIESEGNPKDDPLMVWLTGGPGCSALSGLLYEIGPFTFDYANSTLEKPILEINPHSWTKAASIIFLDQPAGSGFSYARSPQAYITNDTLSTTHAYNFLRKGYVLGNPLTDTSGDYNARIPFAHRMALLSDAIYKPANENCHGEYLNVVPNNSLCIHELEVLDKCIGRIRKPHILEPYCDTTNTLKSDLFRRVLRAFDNTSVDILGLPQVQKQWSRDDNYLYSSAWANSRDVREALHIREEFSDIEWVRCNETLRFNFGKEAISYTHNVMSTVDYHRRFADKNCRALIFSGDDDMVVPYLGTLKWIQSLNLPVLDDWRPWSVDEQVVGCMIKYSKDDYNLTFATVKGGGHTASEYKPKECLTMLMRWFVNDTL